ncbi:MAG: ornithine cyclodeaminase family protein [Candidatus Lokiarchaeota archaeon]|nr:ornithine cyclodeaminase family protein [Candidatus Lokiarchaeota archaeon]
MSEVIILSQDDVKLCLPMNKAIQAVQEAYIAFAKGRVKMPPVMHLDVSQYNGEIDIKSGYIEDFGLIGTKIASGFYDNHKLGLPPGIAIIILMDLKTSMPLAIMDGTYVTAYRTGAAGAVAANVLAKKDSEIIGVIGAGTQARMQIIALNEIFTLKEVKVWDINDTAKRLYSKEMSEQLNITVESVDSVKDAVVESDIVVTVTPSKKALVMKDWIKNGTHINAIGADGPGKQELDPMIIKVADKVVVDSLEQCKIIGEIQHALKNGLIKEKDIHAEIGQILIGDKKGRESDHEITLFDSTGLAAQDIAAANIVYKQAKEKGMGKLISLLD